MIKKTTKLNSFEVAIIVITITSLVLPLLYNQGRMAYDIEQFSPYALLLSSIFSLLTLDHLLAKLHLKSKIWQILAFATLVLISFPSNLTSLKARSSGEKTLITNQELELFNQVTNLTNTTDTILLYPSDRNIATLEFAALTTETLSFQENPYP